MAKRLVVVTGAGSGIGRATARAFAAHGATVVCADLNLETAQATAGSTGVAYQLDVADVTAMERFAEWVRAEHGVPDVVVNNAGIGMGGPFLAHSAEDWRRIIDINLLGVVHGCRLFGAQMAERGRGGHLVNIASAAGFTPSRGLPAYCTTKAAVVMLSECLRADLASQRIGVSAICPGFISTGIYQASRFVGLDEQEQRKRGDQAAAMFRRIAPGPEVVARQILRAVQRNRPVVPVTVGAWATYVLSHLAPPVMRLLARIGQDTALRQLDRQR
ncbi:hypothetical protein GCM10010174_39020 [Kutzneria viridogrisea]|uniref:NAD(P)-dependent dehydrogenase (Short-subunit alcohol dehydrogenase family) n=2 Tax=Kutzneria TaxID=43356 RepID=A0ABR6BMU5_9PSEU|nr:SDR family NAD(P)-dependent oxidoreductase [Kutzneria albida]AHH96552.1 putative oxidoreductase ephD [Kutzneria albida DSM 43870]MBA8928228.1 NAD(P)-dependent dehydrogenase (short-subunit alcohol dehydrogenase family) [Kutzneria viridogrisea]